MLLTPYRPVLRHPVLRRVLPGIAVSALGDGMSVVAIAWLALQIAPDGGRGAWVAAAVAAYSLPSALGGVLLRRYLGHRSGAQLAGWNAILRGGALGAVVVAYAAGVLQPWLYVTLLGMSSLLAAWGSAGRYTLVAEVLPAEHHLAANGVLTAIGEFATIVGPPLAGLLIGRTNAAVLLAVDAASFAVLAATYRLAMPRAGPIGRNPDEIEEVSAADGVEEGKDTTQAGKEGTETAQDGAERGEAERTGETRNRTQRALLVLSFAFFLLFGPFYVALPIHVADDLHAGAGLLGAYYTAFGAGAVAGALASGHLRRLPLWPALTGIIALFGVAMLPLGLGWPVGVALPAFAVAGACWSPYLATVMALFQRTTPVERLPKVLAAFGSVTVIAVPLGTAAGGPLVETAGATNALLASAVGMIVLGGWRRLS
ncbi:MFS transporter [Dactylosporangium darangshiense]|uniref:MFS transporter n=1 Tax=Dactylosporangium darangshiense TaxID=579108 RepID=UPI0036265363